MPRIVNRKYLIEFSDQCYCDQGNNCSFCGDPNYRFRKKANILEEQLRIKKFSTSSSKVNVWKVTYYKNDPIVLTIISVH